MSLFPAAGCNVIGVLAYKASGGPQIAARHVLPKETTLVLVENYHNPAALQMESDAVARYVAEELKLHEVVPLVDAGEAEAHRQSHGAGYRKMPVDAIGRALGARQVIYVDLRRFDLTQAMASEMLGGQAEALVRVVGEDGQVLWPTDSAAGYPVEAKVEPQRVPPGGDPGGVAEAGVRRQLHTALADRIAKLFYAWAAEGADGAEERFSG